MIDWGINVIFKCQECDTIFTPDNLKQISDIENYLRGMQEYQNTCVAKSTIDSSCSEDAIVSPLSLFAQFDLNTITQDQIDYTVQALYNNEE